jgi:hypothetical protein
MVTLGGPTSVLVDCNAGVVIRTQALILTSLSQNGWIS